MIFGCGDGLNPLTPSPPCARDSAVLKKKYPKPNLDLLVYYKIVFKQYIDNIVVVFMYQIFYKISLISGKHIKTKLQ